MLSLEAEYAAQGRRLAAIEDNMQLEQANMIVFDLLRLFLFYFVEPAINKSYPDW
jgi:hypothetical protein